MKDVILDASMCFRLSTAHRFLFPSSFRFPPHCGSARLSSWSSRRRGGQPYRSFTSHQPFTSCSIAANICSIIQVTVGSPSRAHGIALFLDDVPKPFEISSERGFLTITGRYKGVPISIISIGMGYPNMDFFVREARECLNGDMVVIR